MADIACVTLSNDVPSGYHIHSARGHHAQGLLDLHREVAREREYLIHEPDEIRRSAATLAPLLDRLCADPASLCLVATFNWIPVGLMMLRTPRPRRVSHGSRLTLMVSRPHRGKGLGRTMLEIGLGWAEMNPLLLVVSLAVAAHNHAALALYQSLGFEIEGRRRCRLRISRHHFEDELLLSRFVKDFPGVVNREKCE